MRTHRLSIGLPVYNTEKYLEASLNSMLHQTYSDFEIILSDNASTDRTPEICQDYLAMDSRIRYYRQSHNIGGGGNNNFVLKMAQSELFKWQAADDVCELSFLEKCIEGLDQNPQAPLAHPYTRKIDECGAFIEDYLDDLKTDSPHVVQRFAHLVLSYHQCYQIYGVMRREVMSRVGQLGYYVHADGVYLTHMALFGPYVKIPETLFNSRRHSAQSMQTLPSRLHTRRFRLTRKTNGLPSAEWWDPAQKGKLTFPQWRRLAEYLKCIQNSPLSPRERAGCYAVLMRWSRRDYRRYIKDLVIAVDQVLDNLAASRSPEGPQRTTTAAS